MCVNVAKKSLLLLTEWVWCQVLIHTWAAQALVPLNGLLYTMYHLLKEIHFIPHLLFQKLLFDFIKCDRNIW